jgi:hypothetical protein
MILATSVKNKMILEFPHSAISYRLERRMGNNGEWLVLTANGFAADAGGGGVIPLPVSASYLDTAVKTGVYQYRAREFENPSSAYDHSAWVRCGDTGPVGYTFENYEIPEGTWGEILTADDLRLTFLWGIDFRASNGQPYTDEQVRFFINDAAAQIERELKITIKKTRIMFEPDSRGLRQGMDYDVDESRYTYKRERVQRNGMIKTRRRPVRSVSRLDILSRNEKVTSLLNAYTLDKNKGLIKFFNRLPKTSDSFRAVETVIYPYGAETRDNNFFYAIDYVAGYEDSDQVPADLRGVIGKVAAVSLLNNIGRGLMSGFSSSSLSMDGVSESFSSTQSATSAYYGADIKQYESEIKDYIEANKLKFGFITMGAL